MTMQVVLSAVLTASLILCHASVYADVIVEGSRKKIFTSTHISDKRLSEVGFWERSYRVMPSASDGSEGPFYGNRLYAWYQTKQHTDLEEFVFVQFVKGCAFSTYADGAHISVEMDRAREHFGVVRKFIHPDWEIDSIDEDPVYWSTKSTRHDLLRSGGSADVFPDKTGEFPGYGERFPEVPRLFITDMPSGAWWWRRANSKAIAATNVSMWFRTCLYRAKDVPKTARPRDVNFGTPVVCYNWDNNRVYDHATGTMTTPVTLARECQSPSPRSSNSGSF